MRQSCCAVQIGLNERPRAKQNLFFINEVSLDQGSFLLYIYTVVKKITCYTKEFVT